jgi:hypothetical protein
MTNTSTAEAKKPAAKPAKEAFDLLALERACYERSPDRFTQIMHALRHFHAARSGTKREFARAAAAISSAFADPTFTLTGDDLQQLLPCTPPLVSLLRAGGFGGAEHLANLLFPDGKFFAPEYKEENKKLLAFLSPDLELNVRIEHLLNLKPAFALLGVLAAVFAVPTFTAHGEKRRERLLGLAKQVPQADLPPTVSALSLASAAWMVCSYAAHPDKHDIKGVLNQTFRRLLASVGLIDSNLPQKRALKQKPTLLVAAEVINSFHVQFRYYGQYLRQLRSRFKLVLLAPENEVDEPVKALFDEVLPVAFSPKGDHLFQIVIAIKTAQPDIIFWPSIGMQHWGPLIANLRLAPIQMTSVGHPASTLIEAMDYMFLEEGFVLDAALYSEKAILLRDEALRLEHPRNYQPIAPQVREKADVVRIALASNLMKLNPTFVGVLDSIRKRASRPVEFHIFASATPMRQAAFQEAHAATLGRDVFHPRLSPHEYLKRVNACDMALSPFPFGGFHSVIDCLRQGLPVVAMDQPGHPFRTDWMLMRLLGMPDWLVVDDPEHYVEAALRIVEDDALRVELSRQAIDTRIDERLFGDETTPLGTEVVDTMWALYRAHEKVQASPKKAFRLADLQALGG